MHQGLHRSHSTSRPASSCFAKDPEDPASREIKAVRDETNRLVDAGDLELAAQRFVEYWIGPAAWSKTPEAGRLAIAKGMGKVRFEWTTAFDKLLPSANISAIAMPILLLTCSRSTAAARGVIRLLHGLLPQAKVV
jgi:hypothetical protein